MSYHKDVINFGREEANRMAAMREPTPMENKWSTLRKWLTTTTGQEFLDECVYDTVGFDTYNSILHEHGLQPTQGNREHFKRIINQILTSGEG